MKVLVRGTPPEERMYEVTCSNCKSVVEFAQKEGKRQSDQRDGDYIQISCPVCQMPISTYLTSYRK